ncbi:6-phosphogluconolactonase [Occultella glacieicola]|uniref:6-phosphogluconolactonase n=1 Tax=Occultella glacieicola TaxID=2518684 RepID=A0ABY2DWR0_9MICO|nr:6-phosphogluconolactonase [Occultella glacieicola]
MRSSAHQHGPERAVVVHPDAAALAEATAARLLLAILDAQAVRHPVHVALTGGTVGIRLLERARHSPLAAIVDWTGVHLWWGDERFVPRADSERNEGQARAALIDHLPIPARNVHPMAATEDAATAEDGAAAYATELAAAAGPDDERSPTFDVVLLGMGPDAHVASLFPGHPALAATGTTAVAVHDSPKPPPDRISLTFEALAGARQVWLVVAGAEKAEAVRRALGGAADVREAPAGAVRGRDVTLWLLDTAAAGIDAPRV